MVPPAPADFAALSSELRHSTYAALSQPQQRALLASLSLVQLVAIAKDALARLGDYSAELVKQERVGGKLLPVQTIKLGIRERPYALRLEVLDGPGTGRKVLYNSALRPKQLRAKETGFLGIVGGLWLDIDGSLTRAETNHVITDTGFGSTLRLMDKDLAAAQPFGGMVRIDDGFSAAGLYCMRITPPPGFKAYAKLLRLCFDPKLELPVSMESEDDAGVFERYLWRRVQPAQFTDADFTPEAMGL